MSVLTFDELNKLGRKRRSEPIEEYYEPMHISPKRKENRIDTAEKYRDAVLAYMRFIDEYAIYQDSIDVSAKEYLKNAILDVIGDLLIVTQVLTDYAERISSDIHGATMRHSKDPYFLSEDRATFIGEDESNSLWNWEELEEAKLYNRRNKTWNTVGDMAVRPTHVDVDGVTIPLDEPFIVGGYEMMVPRDPEVDAPEETAGCRCWLTFS